VRRPFCNISSLLTLHAEGPSFTSPLLSASILPAILSNICPSGNPSQLVLASLRALSNLVDSSALASNIHPSGLNTIAEGLFARQQLTSLSRILSQTAQSSSVQCQISIAASLISRVCRDERHQQGLASSGVLDALATRLASFVVADGLVIPGAEILAQRDGLQEFIPQAASPNASLSVILEAIAVIIANSKFRASHLLYSSSIIAIFPCSQATEFVANRNTQAAWDAFNVADLSTKQNILNALDFLLPQIPPNQPKSANSQASAFPPLGASGSRENLALNGRKSHGVALSSWADSLNLESGIISQEVPKDLEEPESPLIAYLILLLRTRSGMDRLMAASVLTVLYRTGLTNKTRETAIGLLVIPLLVQMLDDANSSSKSNLSEAEATSLDWAIKEKAPAILAMLITDAEYLQKAAFDSGAIGKLSKLLKVAYDPVFDVSVAQGWTPQIDAYENEFETAQFSELGDRGQSPLLAHKIKVRESTLKAIAALVPFKDEYRKAIVDQGITPYVVESMNPNPSKPMPKFHEKSDKNVNSQNEDEVRRGYGVNPINVLIAACGALRALSRSVSILRTTLIDNGVAMPAFRLLRHPDVKVQIAATGCVINLVTDISPMREVSWTFSVA
jgi:hypothetical protein